MFLWIKKYWNIATVLILLAGIGWIKLSSISGSLSDSSVSVPHQGFKAPDFTLQTSEGGEITLSDLQGQVVLANFWTSWCPPCRAEMPDIQQVYEDYQGQKFTVLAINSTIQDQSSEAIKFIQTNGLTFPVLFDISGKVTAAYRIDALPTSFFIDRDGIIREIVIGGPMPEALLREHIEKLLTEGD